MLSLIPLPWKIAGVLALVLAVAGGVWLIYHKGEVAGSAAVTTKVQETTIKTIDKARTEKDKAESVIRAKPIDEVIDGLK